MPEPLSDAARILGERIRDQRNRFALSQDDIANLTGMNVSNYGKVERGLINPRFYTIIRIAHVLGIDPGVLLTGLTAEDLPEQSHVFTAREFVNERRERG